MTRNRYAYLRLSDLPEEFLDEVEEELRLSGEYPDPVCRRQAAETEALSRANAQVEDAAESAYWARGDCDD